MKAEEIKFKAQREDGKGWVYGDLIHGVNHKSGKTYILPVVGGVRPLSGCDPLDGYEVYPETICQFTGLKDKNGVEIYEGDKFQYLKHDGYWPDDFIGVVGFKEGCFGYDIITEQSDISNEFHPFSYHDELKEDFLDNIEVIGNIHDKYKQQ